MVWTEFWNGLFSKCLQHCILAILVAITIVIFILICVGCVLGIDYLIDKQANAKRKTKTIMSDEKRIKINDENQR